MASPSTNTIRWPEAFSPASSGTPPSTRSAAGSSLAEFRVPTTGAGSGMALISTPWISFGRRRRSWDRPLQKPLQDGSVIHSGDAIIIGASSAEQLGTNLASLDNGPLPDVTVKALDEGWAIVKPVAKAYFS
ncbi:hypothetical protein GE09DRAFT_195886 [Coniochaeta sp. 2T2.1]|nr:hypothetical protein GE09DRAFT_195886 [Coniochaeta sp. 2T2.1]